MSKFLPFVLFLGILANTVLVLVFKLRIDRKYNDQFLEFSNNISENVYNLSSNALARIDYYFYSNVVRFVSSQNPVNGSLDGLPPVPPSDDVQSPILPVVGSVEFHYFKRGGVPFVRIGFENYRVGDVFPQGGIITDLFPDSVILNGSFRVSNTRSLSAYSSKSSNVSTDVIPPQKLTPSDVMKGINQ